jgi:hypothetical protein
MSVGLERESIMPDLYSGPQGASWRGIALNTIALAAGLRCNSRDVCSSRTFWAGVLPIGTGNHHLCRKCQIDDGNGIDGTC